ncbi:MAG: hypothetical protein HKN82_18755 [Akkermansiaceae bacterium]|nr:hypothetical protein [Akkermansiaceae bacterium]NNM30917.1 hypothetical protein [Akkermansiaceae bacterium]
MSTAKTIHPVSRAALGIAALIVIVILANWLMQLSPLGKKNLDLTENQVHTLSQGTREILKSLDAPVVIRYYATRKSEAMSRDLKLYMRKVDDLLQTYQTLAGGQLRVERLDPQPDTDAEDSANLDGMRGERIIDGTYEENIYHGIAISSLDQTQTIPFLDPRSETRLEYELSRAIAQVSQPKKPVVGIMSSLPITGGPAAMPGQRPQEPWVFYQQLQQSYDLRDLGMTPESIDPDEITLLLVLHPGGITPQAEFAIDQYLLGGGTMIACVDPHSIAAQMAAPQNPMMQQPPAETSSNLPTLLKAWGIEFDAARVIADPEYRTRLADGRVGVGLLSLGQAAMPNRKDDLITQSLNDLYFVLSGGFKVLGGKGVDSSSLVRTTREAALVNAMQASRLDQRLLTETRPDDYAYDLVLHLSGKFKTAFPDGDPSKEKSAAEQAAEAENSGGEEDAPAEEEDSSLKEAVESTSVFLIADSDFIYDQFAYRPVALGNIRMYSPATGNSSLLFNMIDQASGSKHLIGSRSRASSRRPFTLVDKMEADFEQERGKKIAEIEAEIEKAQTRLSELQSQKSQGTELYLSPEQEAEIVKLRQKNVEARRAIRELQKDLKREKDKLSANVTILNVLIIPLAVAILGILVQMRRRSVTEAR